VARKRRAVMAIQILTADLSDRMLETRASGSFAVIVFSLFWSFALSSFANWSAHTIDVHEWGVNVFDWNPRKPLTQDFPDYFYTEKLPGEFLPGGNPRVRDLRPDSGMGGNLFFTFTRHKEFFEADGFTAV
jgi:hypothetical protein